jgi:hypothetical protein
VRWADAGWFATNRRRGYVTVAGVSSSFETCSWCAVDNQVVILIVASLVAAILGGIAGPWFQAQFGAARIQFSERDTETNLSIPLGHLADVKITSEGDSFYSAQTKAIRIFNPTGRVIGNLTIKFSRTGGPPVNLTRATKYLTSRSSVSFKNSAGANKVLNERDRSVTHEIGPIEARQLIELRLEALSAHSINVAVMGCHFVRRDFDFCGKSLLNEMIIGPKYSSIRFAVFSGMLALTFGVVAKLTSH